jgi:hypothetical protein
VKPGYAERSKLLSLGIKKLVQRYFKKAFSQKDNEKEPGK